MQNIAILNFHNKSLCFMNLLHCKIQHIEKIHIFTVIWLKFNYKIVSGFWNVILFSGRQMCIAVYLEVYWYFDLLVKILTHNTILHLNLSSMFMDSTL